MTKRASSPLRRSAPVFAALGDATRLELVRRLATGSRLSIATLATGTRLTRQAITKHLSVLEKAGIVRGVRHGRQNLFQLRRQSLDQAHRALEQIGQQWDDALQRLRTFVES